MIDIEKYKDYVQSESPNKGRISTIVNNIKGNRTAAVYASDIGLNAARISRIINGVYSNALDFDTLVKLADGNEFYLERLLSANGTLSPKELEEKNLRSDFQELKIERQKREDTFFGIHRKAFIDFLYMVRICNFYIYKNIDDYRNYCKCKLSIDWLNKNSWYMCYFKCCSCYA